MTPTTKDTLQTFKARSYRQLMSELVTHKNRMQAYRATSNLVTLGFLDALEDAHEQELITLKRKLRMCQPQKIPSIGGVTAGDIARAKTMPVSTYLKVGRDNKVNCLFHNDKVASMHVYKDGVHCFSCQHHTDVIGVVMKLRSMRFVDAVKFMTNCA